MGHWRQLVLLFILPKKPQEMNDFSSFLAVFFYGLMSQSLIHEVILLIRYRKILELYFSGISQRTISSTVGSSRHTIREVTSRADQKGMTKLTADMSDSWIQEYLFPEKEPTARGYFPVDWEYVHKELMKKNMTLKLLHREYEYTARSSHKIPYSYRSYCYRYADYAKKFKLTMPIRRKPGEIMEVDWAESTLHVFDRDTGEKIKAYVFIATLPYSQYSYVEAFLDMKSASWLTAHIHAFEFFGGVTESIVLIISKLE